MLKWCFQRNQKNFTILIGNFRLLTWALPFAQWKIAAAATSACNTVEWTYTTQLKYGTLPFKYFQGYNQFLGYPVLQKSSFIPQMLLLFFNSCSAWLGNHVKCTPVSRGGRRGASRLSPAKRAKGGAFWYSYVL
jgi:hypothetical protein